MKKRGSLLVCLCLCGVLAGCSSQGKGNGTDTPAAQTEGAAGDQGKQADAQSAEDKKENQSAGGLKEGAGQEADKAGAAQEEEKWPASTITLIAGAKPGGATDIAARALAVGASEYFNGQPVVVVNKPGSNSMVAAKEVVSSKPDGLTLLAGWGNVEFTFQRYISELPVDTFQDFKPVIGMISYSSCLAVPMDSQFQTLEDLVGFARENPGKLKWTHSGQGGTHWLLGMDFCDKAGIEMTEVPNSEGGAEARNMVAGNHVDVGVFASFLGADYADDKIRVLAVAFPQRDEIMPDVPTFAESGYDVVDAYDIKVLAAPAGVEDWKIDKLYEGFRKAMDEPECQEMLKNSNFTPLYWTPEECMEHVTELDANFKELAEQFKERMQ